MTSKQTRQHVLGVLVRHWRASQGLSVEALAERAHIAHTTLRRLEDGHSVWPRTYSSIEQATELPAGMVIRALADDEALIELAGRLGIEVPGDQRKWPNFINGLGKEKVSAQEVNSNSSLYAKLGQIVVTRRVQLGLSQADLARAAAISDMTLRNLEKGRSASHQFTLTKVERALRWKSGVLCAALDTGELDTNCWIDEQAELDTSEAGIYVAPPNNNTSTDAQVLVSRDLLYRTSLALYRCATDSINQVPKKDEIALADEIYAAVREASQS